MRIGLVTCVPEKLRDYFPTAAEPDFVPTELPFTPDDQILVDELRLHGHHVEPVTWGGPIDGSVRPLDRLVIRSPWDYMDSDGQRRQFMQWLADLDQAGIAVENHPRLMAWLTDKRYLKDLETVAVPVVPTEPVPPGEPLRLLEKFVEWGPLIVKPSVSAAGAGLVFLTSLAETIAFEADFQVRVQPQWYLVQPFLPEIRDRGEWSLVYLGGVYSHAVHKLPGEGKILVHAEQGGSLRFAEPPASVQTTGDRVLARMEEAFAARLGNEAKGVRFPPLYLRVDVIESAAGPVISECEGVEPELFFRAWPGSERRFRELLENSLHCNPAR